MILCVFGFLAVVNVGLWFLAFCATQSSDKSGAGMVLMFLLPFNVFVGLVSLIIVGFLT